MPTFPAPHCRLCPPYGWDRLLCLWVVFLGLAGGLTAQTVVAELHLSKKEPRPQWFEYVTTDDGLVTLAHGSRFSSRNLNINKYNAAFDLEWTAHLLEFSGHNRISQLMCLGGDILVFVDESFPKSNARATRFARYASDGELLLPFTLLHRTDELRGSEPHLRYTRSINKRLLLAYRTERTGNQPEQFVAYLFRHDDVEPEPIHLALPYSDQTIQLKDVQVANDGTIYLLAKHLLKPNPKQPADYRYLMIRLRPGSDRLEEYSLPFEGVHITDLILKPEPNGNLTLAGFYSERNTNQLAGSLFLRLDGRADSILAQRATPFPPNLLSYFLTPKQINSGAELTDLYLDDIVLRSDGGALLLAEEYYVTTATFPDVHGFWFTEEFFNYGNIIVLSISPTGELDWHAVVEKFQSAEYPAELSYLPVVTPNGVNLFYKTRLKGVGSNVFLSQISFDGKLSPPKPFFKKFYNNDIFYRRSSEQIRNNQAILVYLQGKRKTFSFIKVQW